MHDAAWVKLLRHIPAHEHSNLMLVTTAGTEIAIQALLRIDPECLALRGRLAGSTDAGRVFFVPYAHIHYFGFQQPLEEAAFHELFANLEPLCAADPSAVLSPPGSAEPASPAFTSPTPLRSPLAIKSAVLEKFRARSASNSGAQNRPTSAEDKTPK